MKDKDDTLLPDKYRNKLYKFMAGGYDGCICHPAALFVTGDGRVRLIGSDGGRGGLDAGDWYARTMRSFLDELGVASADMLLYGEHKNPEAYDRYLKYARDMKEERHRKERLIVRVALDAELGKDSLTGVRWDHEFQEFDISTPENVTDTCKKMCNAFYDVYFHAAIAQKLSDEGYEGAGIVCTRCKKFVTHTDREDFSNCIDSESYHGIGGLAVAHTSILCDDCRYECECESCFEIAYPENMSFEDKFFWDWLKVCDGCNWKVFDRYKGAPGCENDLRAQFNEAEAKIGGMDEELNKYLEVMKSNGTPDAELERLREENEERFGARRNEILNELRDKLQKDVEEIWPNEDCILERAKERL